MATENQIYRVMNITGCECKDLIYLCGIFNVKVFNIKYTYNKGGGGVGASDMFETEFKWKHLLNNVPMM